MLELNVDAIIMFNLISILVLCTAFNYATSSGTETYETKRQLFDSEPYQDERMYDDQTYLSFKEQNQHNALSDNEYELMPATRNYFDLPDLLQHDGSDATSENDVDIADGKFHDVKGEFLMLPEESTNMFESSPFEGEHRIENPHHSGKKISSTLEDDERKLFKEDQSNDEDEESPSSGESSGSGTSESSGSGEQPKVPFATPKTAPAAAAAPPLAVQPLSKATTQMVEPKPNTTSVKYMLNGTKITQFNTGIKDNKGTKQARWKYIPGDTMPGFEDTNVKNAAGYKHLARPGEETEPDVEKKEQEYKKKKQLKLNAAHSPTSSAVKASPTNMYLIDVKPFNIKRHNNKNESRHHVKKTTARNLTAAVQQAPQINSAVPAKVATVNTKSNSLRRGHTYRIYQTNTDDMHHHKHHHSKKRFHSIPSNKSVVSESTHINVQSSNLQNTLSAMNNSSATAPVNSPLSFTTIKNSNNNNGDSSENFHQKPQRNFDNQSVNSSASNSLLGDKINTNVTDFTADVDVETPDQDQKAIRTSSNYVAQSNDDGSGQSTNAFDSEGSGNEVPLSSEDGSGVKKPEKVVPVGSQANATGQQHKQPKVTPTQSSTKTTNTPTESSTFTSAAPTRDASKTTGKPTEGSSNSTENKDSSSDSTEGNDNKNKASKKGNENEGDTLIPEAADQKQTSETSSTESDYSDTLRSALRHVRFKNGDGGTVKAGQEFAYISQCGLYTEPQNVSTVQHSWVTKTYSPYFYLYEKPRQYEKCKPSPWMNGTDMRGSVFLSFEVKSLHGSTMSNNAKICEKYCCKEPRCAAWVLRFQKDGTANCPSNSFCCWLKTSVPKPEARDSCISGVVKRDHYRHPPIGMRSAVPLGGLGSGSFELRADGTFHEWTIENQSPGGSAKLSKTSLDMMLLGFRVRKGSQKAKSAIIRTHAPHGYRGVASLTYSGSYPVSRLQIDLDGQLRKEVEMDLYAYSAFHPRSPKKSATPAVAFSLDITNPTSEKLDVSLFFNLPFGYNDDTIRRGNNFAEVAFTRLVTSTDCQNACAKKPKCMAWTTNGPFACMLKDGMPLHSYEYGIISGLKGDWSVKDGILSCERPGFYPQSGGISMYPVVTGAEKVSHIVTDDVEAAWKEFEETGRVNSNDTDLNTTGLNGAVSISAKLKPKESKLLTIILSWYFPNRDLADERVGNFYNNLFKSSMEVAKHYKDDLIDTVNNVRSWQQTMMPPQSIYSVTSSKENSKDRDQDKSCDVSKDGVHSLPECLQDILSNSLSFLRSGMWMENGRWRQWEAYDCANMDAVHIDFHRILPYVIFYPDLAKQVMLAWADHQQANGMIQESLSLGCLEETSKEGVAGGRLMTDVNVGFIVQAYLLYAWTNDTGFFDEIYPFTVRATNWLVVEATKGTGLPYRKPDTYDLFDLEKYDHCTYNSILYMLALRTSITMATIKNDKEALHVAKEALDRAEKQFDVEMWDERKQFYHAWFDNEWGSPAWLMADSFYGQVWAYSLGLGDLVSRNKLKAHLLKERERNDTPFGLKVISQSEGRSPLAEDTSLILGDEVNSCRSLENVTKFESVWMSASPDWSSLELYLGMNPNLALHQASKSLDNYRSNLRDEWNFHGLTSSQNYGLDGLPWATSHYTFHLVAWHIPLALSGQFYYAPNGTLSFEPKFEPPYWLPFFTPFATGHIECLQVARDRSTEILYKLSVSSGTLNLNHLSISGSKYSSGKVTVREGDMIEWSKPKKSKVQIMKDMLDQLKHRR